MGRPTKLPYKKLPERTERGRFADDEERGRSKMYFPEAGGWIDPEKLLLVANFGLGGKI